MIEELRFARRFPRLALCDWGIWGCEMHKRSGLYVPLWKRLIGKS